MKGTLLIVDDEPELLKSLELILNKYADKVLLAYNGEEALEICQKHKVHCILCDINMPVMNGVEVIKNIRELKMDTPFIFYTGHGTEDLMREAIKYGAFDFLDKPELVGLIEVIIRGLARGTGADSHGTEASDFMSEYQKLITSLN